MSENISRLGTILAAIGKRLPKDVIYRVGGRDEVAKMDAARRIVMEPWQRAYEGAHRAGGQLFTRLETVRMHIWGSDHDEVEELEELLVNAIIATVTWAVRPGTGSWRNKGESGRGVLAVQEMGFLVPIIRREEVAALPADGEITGEIEALV